MESIVYVSRNEIDDAEASAEVGRIVSAAQKPNRLREITGGLIFTGRHFAQILEGPTRNLDALLHSLTADPRHSALSVIARRPIERRFFFDWSLAYSGEPMWVDHHIEPLFSAELSEKMRAEEEARVAQLMVQFALLRRCAA